MKIKKILSAALALLMVLSLAPVSFAANNDAPSVAIELVLDNPPAPGRGYYIDGEIVEVHGRVINAGTEDLGKIEVVGPGLNRFRADHLPVSSSEEFTFSVEVDVEAIWGAVHVDATVTALGASTGESCSDTASIYLRYDMAQRGDGAVNLSVGEPALPECGYFTAGDIVSVPFTVSTETDVHELCVKSGVEPGNSFYFGDMYKNEPESGYITVCVTEEDCENGLTVAAVAECRDRFEWRRFAADFVDIPVKTADEEPSEEALGISLIAPVLPERGYFLAGESVELRYAVEDLGSEPFAGSIKAAAVQPDRAALSVTQAPFEASAAHVVNWLEVSNGGFWAYALMDYTCSDGAEKSVYSVPVWIPCGEEISIVISDKAVSSPANGLYYVPGETVSYLITAENVSPCEQRVNLADWVFNGSVFASSENWDFTIPAGGSESVITTYTVTEEDAKRDFASAYAFASGNGWTVLTDYVFVPAGLGELEGAVRITNALDPECISADGAGFAENETLDYFICVANDSDKDISELSIYDSRSGSVVEVMETLAAGEKALVRFSTEVSAADCKTGWILNTAFASWKTADGEEMSAVSNTTAILSK